MNILYTVCDDSYIRYTAKMLESLATHAKNLFGVNLAYVSPGENILEIIDDIRSRRNIIGWINYLPIQSKNWNQNRMTAKIEWLERANFCVGDNVIVMDGDILFQGDPFDVFDDPDFDVFLTTRHYDYWYKANGGVWGLRWNASGKAFVNFFISQIRNPIWEPYVDFMKKWRHCGKPDWFIDQDFLCTALDNKLPFFCRVKNAGWRYNYCPTVEENQPETWEKAKAEMEAAIGNPDIKVLHFKGRLREIML